MGWICCVALLIVSVAGWQIFLRYHHVK